MPRKGTRGQHGKRRRAAWPTEEERCAYEEHLTTIIEHLWAKSPLPHLRELPSLQAARAWLGGLQSESYTLYQREYRRLILAFTNQGEAAVWRDGQLPAPQLAAPRLDATAREGYDALVFTILRHAGLFNPQAPFEHLDYQTLVAHLLLALDEIHDARRLEDPFPWPWRVERHEGRPLLVARELGIRDREQRIADRVERALSQQYETPVTLPPRSAAAERRLQKEEARLRAGDVANQMYSRLSPVEILLEPRFTEALKDAGAHLETADGVLKLIREFRKAKGLPPLKRGRRPLKRAHA